MSTTGRRTPDSLHGSRAGRSQRSGASGERRERGTRAASSRDRGSRAGSRAGSRRGSSAGGSRRGSLASVASSVRSSLDSFAMGLQGIGPDEREKMAAQEESSLPVSDQPICSDMVLQMLLYFHVYFSVVWFLMYWFLWQWKTENMEYKRAVKVLSPTIFAIWAFAEGPRLLFGYTGNLKEKVPQMASFFLLTVFPSLPALAYFLFAEVNKLPLDWALHVIQFGFTLAELVFGYRALRLLIRSQRDRFAVQAHADKLFKVAPDKSKQP